MSGAEASAIEREVSRRCADTRLRAGLHGMTTRIDALLTGPAVPFGPNGEPSAVNKQTTHARLRVGVLGLEGDEQGDRKHHGGPEKAIHHYARDHYPAWIEELPSAAALLASPGAFGENVSTLGMTERTVCIGDVYRLGTAVVQVSQARQPCWRLNVRFNVGDMARRVQTCRRTGWYYRVLEPGEVAAGDSLTLVERPSSGWTLERILVALYVDRLNSAELESIASLTSLAEGWRRLARRRLESRVIEDWSRRLESPSRARGAGSVSS